MSEEREWEVSDDRSKTLLLKAFREERHREDFLDGKMYCQTVDFHRKQDKEEGCWVLDADRIAKMQMKTVVRLPGGKEMEIHPTYISRTLGVGEACVFCMYAWIVPYLEGSETRVVVSKEQIGSLRNLAERYGEYAVIVSPHDLWERFDAWARRDDRPYRRDQVTYDYATGFAKHDIGAVFIKNPKYKGEQEYRFAFATKESEKGGPVIAEIGSVRQHAVSMRTRDLYDANHIASSR